MSDQTSTQKEDRDAAVQKWEKEHNRSVVAEDRKKLVNGAAMAGFAIALLVGAWYLKNGGSAEAEKPASSDLTIAERKPVPKLKDQPAAAVTTVEPAAEPMRTETPADDALRAQREQLEAQRREQERRMLEARLKSSLMANSSNPASAPGPQAGEAAEPGQGSPGGLGSGDRGPQDANSRFMRSVSGFSVAANKASQVDNLQYKVLQGKLIEAVLEPRATSDLPGLLCAVVQRDVYGSQGRVKLIPWGSRVCGTYSAELRKGQDRLFAVWNTLRRPDGVQVTLDSIGADQLGTAGMGGKVDTHFMQIFGMSALLSIIGAGSSNVGVSSFDRSNSASAYREAVQEAAADTATQILEPYANIPPTVTVPAGSRIRIYVNKDLDFSPVYHAAIDDAKRDGVTFIQ